MPLLIPLVLLHEVEVVPADNDGPVHLGAVACSSYDSAPDGNSTREWALFVDVSALDGFPWGLEAKANTLPETVASLARPLSLVSLLCAEENLGLLEERLLGLLRHGCAAGFERRGGGGARAGAGAARAEASWRRWRWWST